MGLFGSKKAKQTPEEIFAQASALYEQKQYAQVNKTLSKLPERDGEANYLLGITCLAQEAILGKSARHLGPAKHFLGRAAKQGHAKAAELLANGLDEFGYRPETAAVMLSPEELFEAGMAAYRDGNKKRAMEFLELAAGRGSLKAAHNCGVFYCRDEEGIPQDLPRALHWLEMSALQGDTEAQRLCVMLYQGGVGTPADPAAAAAWEKAAGETGGQK